MSTKSLIAALGLAFVALAMPGPATAQESDTLKRIRTTETIIVG
jgi:threonine/homoserine/homoserine lactone efflux protein